MTQFETQTQAAPHQLTEPDPDGPLVGIIMGSQSDMELMQKAGKVLEEAEVTFELHVMSAHRHPDKVAEYCRTARQRGLRVIIAGAGGSAHLPGMTAAKTHLPVLGVPVHARLLPGTGPPPPASHPAASPARVRTPCLSGRGA